MESLKPDCASALQSKAHEDQTHDAMGLYWNADNNRFLFVFGDTGS